MASRRTFLKAGALAAVALALSGGYHLLAARGTPLAQAFGPGGSARAALAAIIPVLLAGALPAPASPSCVSSVTDRVYAAILGLPLSTQQEVQALFDLLALAPARHLMTGVAGPWADANPSVVHAFLQDWRVSQVGMLRAGYAALHDLVLGVWYAEPANWHAIGYPGPALLAPSLLAPS